MWAEALLNGFAFEKVIADRGYAGAAFSAYLHDQGSESVIPPHQAAKRKRDYDAWLYRERQRRIDTLKHVRRIFSRFDKLDRSYLGFVQFVCALVWLR